MKDSELDKQEVELCVYKVLGDSLGIDSSSIKSTDDLSKLNVDTDDWTFLFIPELQESLKLTVPVKAWSEVSTIEEIVQLFVEQGIRSDEGDSRR